MGLYVFSLPISLVMIEWICILSYYHHQIGSMNYYPLFRVRSWNNGVRCMSFYILIHTGAWFCSFVLLCKDTVNAYTSTYINRQICPTVKGGISLAVWLHYIPNIETMVAVDGTHVVLVSSQGDYIRVKDLCMNISTISGKKCFILWKQWHAKE